MRRTLRPALTVAKTKGTVIKQSRDNRLLSERIGLVLANASGAVVQEADH
jgi:hypothetical protein